MVHPYRTVRHVDAFIAGRRFAASRRSPTGSYRRTKHGYGRFKPAHDKNHEQHTTSQRTKVRGMAQAGILELVHVGKRGPRIAERSVRTLINKWIPNEIPENTEPRERSSLSLVELKKKKVNR
jgi:hypothetical protein